MCRGFLLAAFLFVDLFIPTENLARRIDKIASAYLVRETIDGTAFTYREDIINGRPEKSWYVNGHRVEHDEYKEKLLDALREEARKEFEEEEEHRSEQNKFKVSCSLEITKKLIKETIRLLEDEIRNLNKHDLGSYYAWDSDIPDFEALKEITDNFIPSARLLVDRPEGEVTLDELNATLALLEPWVKKLRNFFRDSVNKAIKLSDDTKTLKGLLEVVS